MKRKSNLLGNVPKRGSQLDRNLYAEQLGLSKEQLHKAYNNWTQAFRIPGTTLTFEQYMNKLREAGITPSEVNNVDGYNLSRYNDEGPYTNESCRFIPAKMNIFEQEKFSPYERTLNKYGEEQTRNYCAEGGKRRWDQ